MEEDVFVFTHLSITIPLGRLLTLSPPLHSGKPVFISLVNHLTVTRNIRN